MYPDRNIGFYRALFEQRGTLHQSDLAALLRKCSEIEKELADLRASVQLSAREGLQL